jgi:hypothetical protein
MGNNPGTGGGSGLGGNGFGANLFLQNLLQLSRLTSLDFSAHLLYNLAFTGSDNKLGYVLLTPGPTGGVPTGTSENPFIVSGPIPISNPTIKSSKVYTSTFTNQSSPVTIFSHSFTPVSANSTLLLLAGTQINNVSNVSSTVDVSIEVGSTVYTSSRTFQSSNTDIGSTALYTYYPISGSGPVTIKVIATLVTGSTNLSSAAAYLSIIEF